MSSKIVVSLSLVLSALLGYYGLKLSYWQTSGANSPQEPKECRFDAKNGPVTIVTKHVHPGFIALQLNQRAHCILRKGDPEARIDWSLGPPLNFAENTKVYNVGNVSYDWDSEKAYTRVYLGVRLSPDKKVEELMALTPEYAKVLLEKHK